MYFSNKYSLLKLEIYYLLNFQHFNEENLTFGYHFFNYIYIELRNMKKNYLLILLFIVVLTNLKSQLSTEGFNFDSEARTYLLYVPTSYDTITDTLSLVLALHGLGDFKENFNTINGLQALAESEKFILVTPQAENPTENLTVNGFSVAASTFIQRAWHSGAGGTSYTINGNTITLSQAYYASETRNDVGFLSSLIDTVSKNFNIDSNRVFSTGFSMGGFMTNRLACELSNKIAAIASVSGTIGEEIENTCNPNAVIPALHIHSFDDEVVQYTNNNWGMDAEETVNFWINNNNTNTTPDTTDLSAVASDFYDSFKYLYSQGDSASEVAFYQLDGPLHIPSWYVGINDFNAATVIWDFFNRHTKKRTVATITPTPTPSGITDIKDISFEVFPNPTTDYITISFSEKLDISNIAITNTLGKKIQFQTFDNLITEATFNLKDEPKGVYYFQVEDSESNNFVVRFFKK